MPLTEKRVILGHWKGPSQHSAPASRCRDVTCLAYCARPLGTVCHKLAAL